MLQIKQLNVVLSKKGITYVTHTHSYNEGGEGANPVCRIIEYKKFLYDQKKKQKEIKAKQQKVVVKEIRFGPNTDDHDFQFKLKHAKKFLLGSI